MQWILINRRKSKIHHRKIHHLSGKFFNHPQFSNFSTNANTKIELENRPELEFVDFNISLAKAIYRSLFEVNICEIKSENVPFAWFAQLNKQRTNFQFHRVSQELIDVMFLKPRTVTTRSMRLEYEWKIIYAVYVWVKLEFINSFWHRFCLPSQSTQTGLCGCILKIPNLMPIAVRMIII